MKWIKIECSDLEYENLKKHCIEQEYRFRGGRIGNSIIKGIDKNLTDDKHYPLSKVERKGAYIFLGCMLICLYVTVTLLIYGVKWGIIK